MAKVIPFPKSKMRCPDGHHVNGKASKGAEVMKCSDCLVNVADKRGGAWVVRADMHVIIDPAVWL